MKRWPALLLAGVLAAAAAQAPGNPGRLLASADQDDDEDRPWQELQVVPPAFPKAEDLVEFYVSAVATNMYYIDASTLAVGADGVVRYVLVVKTSGGATNVSLEGIRCADLTWKLYATGHPDKTWTKLPAIRAKWRPIEKKPVNPYHAALSHDYFCPTGTVIRNAEAGRNALRLGKHPDAE